MTYVGQNYLRNIMRVIDGYLEIVVADISLHQRMFQQIIVIYNSIDRINDRYHFPFDVF